MPGDPEPGNPLQSSQVDAAGSGIDQCLVIEPDQQLDLAGTEFKGVAPEQLELNPKAGDGH